MLDLSHKDLEFISFALVIARLQMKTNAAIMTAMEEFSAQRTCENCEKQFEELAQRIKKATTQ